VVGLKPRKSGVRYSKIGVYVREEDLVVCGVKCCSEIEGNNDGGFARVRGEKNTV